MAHIVTWEDIEQSNPQLLSVSTTPTRILLSRLGMTMRTFFSIVPITAGVTCTITLGPVGVVVSQGTVVIQNQPFAQSIVKEGRPEGCYQGEVWVTASAAGQVSIQETIEQGGVN